MYANWQSDAYTTALTSPQQGVAPLVGLTTYETITVNDAGHEVTTVNTATCWRIERDLSGFCVCGGLDGSIPN